MRGQLLPWHWRSLPLERRTGSELFERLFLAHPIATLLESPFPTPDGRSPGYSICASVPRWVAGQRRLWTPTVGDILPWLRRLLRQADPTDGETCLPFTGGWLGWFGYDLAWEIESLPRLKPDPLPFPVAYWYEPDSFAVLDHGDQTLWLAATDPADLDRLQHRLEKPPSDRPDCPLITQAPRFLTSQADYEAAVRQVKRYISAGDIFQANLSLRFQTGTTADSWTIYRRLQHINPSPFASYWRTPWGAVISCSPERLVKLQGKQAQTRPIAGTRRRGQGAVEEQQMVQSLLGSAKERAEHIMLVDLERNDLGRVCQWGSVQVDELFTIERYSHVMHLVSNVTGTLREEADAVDLIRALFPGGTITGCPKVRCMEIIEELEPLRRSLFYGSCGYIDQRGHLDLNILIRTLLWTAESSTDNRVLGQVGAGIVADSDPTHEWIESLDKAQAQIAALKPLLQ